MEKYSFQIQSLFITPFSSEIHDQFYNQEEVNYFFSIGLCLLFIKWLFFFFHLMDSEYNPILNFTGLLVLCIAQITSAGYMPH